MGFRGRREQREQLRLHRRTTQRDLLVFLAFLSIALALGLVGTPTVRYVAAAMFVLAYGIYAWRSIVASGETGGEEELSGLFFDPSKHDPPHNVQIVLQVLAGLALIIGGAHLFVTEVEHIAQAVGVSALVLALVLAPLATEMPEKLNSVLWVRQGKDALALGNITGAMVFQSMIPVAVGLAFVNWQLEGPAVVAAVAALLGGLLCLLVLQRGARFSLPAVAAWAVLYGGGIGAVLLVS